MVYDGKPSKGCGNCRSRKIKCDQTRPTCRECTRTNRECPGYRDEWNLMLRDETKSVAQKGRSSKQSQLASNYSTDLQATGYEVHAEENIRHHMHHARESTLGKVPDTEVSKHEAICFFLQSHAIPGNSQIKNTLITLLMSSSSPGISSSQHAVKCSIMAVASAMLSRVRGSPPLSQIARQEYGSALQLVNQALSDTNEAKMDNTLFAIVLLALYEVRSPHQTQKAAEYSQ